LPENQREVTAILLHTRQFENPVEAMKLTNEINDAPLVQAVHPSAVVYSLFESFVYPLRLLLLALTVLVIVVAGIGVMVSIYNSMNDRRRDIAIMRSLGARRTTVMTVILLESILLSLGGGIAGVVLGHAMTVAVSPWIVAHTGVSIGFFQFHWIELRIWETNLTFPTEPVLVPCLIAFATLVGFLPATTAYRTDVAKALSLAP
jgi:putative ABC transport system permease protein